MLIRFQFPVPPPAHNRTYRIAPHRPQNSQALTATALLIVCLTGLQRDIDPEDKPTYQEPGTIPSHPQG